jgi:hypothetical protein
MHFRQDHLVIQLLELAEEGVDQDEGFLVVGAVNVAV